MIFKKLELHNFKSHKSTIIEFTKGINVIVGENGAGKSTIFEGISFALFKQHTGKRIDDLVRNNTSEMSVVLEFEANGVLYKIERIKKSSLKSSLYVFNNLSKKYTHLCTGDKDVAQSIEEILNMDSGLFLNAVYIRQGEIANLLDKTSSEKKQLIGKLLGLDSLENMWKQLSSVINGYEKELSHLEGELSSFDEIQSEFEEKKSQLKQLKEEIQKDTKKISSTEEDLAKIVEDYSAMKEKREKHIEISEKVIVCEEKLKVLASRIDFIEDKLKRIAEKQDEFNTLEKQVSEFSFYPELQDMIEYCEKEKDLRKNILKELALFEEREASEKELLSSLHKVEDLKNIEFTTLDKAEEIINYFTNDIDDALTSLQDCRESCIIELADINSHINLYKEQLTEFKSIDSSGVCPVCLSEISNERLTSLEEEYTQKLQIYKEKRDSTIKLEDETQISIQEFSEKKKKFVSYLNSIRREKESRDVLEVSLNYDLLKEQLEETQEKISKMNARIDDMIITHNVDVYHIDLEVEKYKENKAKYDRLKVQLEEKESIESEYEMVMRDIKETTSKLDEGLTKIFNNGFDEEQFNILESKERGLNISLERLETKLALNKSHFEEDVNSAKKLLEKMNERYIAKQKYDIIDDFISYLKDLKELCGKNNLQKELRLLSKPVIEKYTNDFFNEFDFIYSYLSLDEDYDVNLYGPEGFSSATMISGGEKIAVSLALRFGITNAISGGVDSILLDEPTIHLDENRKEDLVRVFNEVSLVPQLIIVTHDVELEHSADVMFRIKKENGISYLDN